jgi:hypothetical protein
MIIVDCVLGCGISEQTCHIVVPIVSCNIMMKYSSVGRDFSLRVQPLGISVR